jgi:hypothetical protein
MTMGENASNPAVYGEQTNAVVIQHNQMVQITINNTDAGQHPFHLHGHIFQIVHRSFDVLSDDPEINPPMIEGQTKVYSRDVVMVPPGGSTTIRFKADNPGVWFFHCHMYVVLGLRALLGDGSADTSSDLLFVVQRLASLVRPRCHLHRRPGAHAEPAEASRLRPEPVRGPRHPLERQRRRPFLDDRPCRPAPRPVPDQVWLDRPR